MHTQAKNFIAGFSTLEMLIAMSVLILTLSAVTLTSFGNQSVLVDSQLDAEALGKAQELLENTQTLSRKDFQMVNPTTTAQTLGGITYTKKLTVIQSDYFTKQITANVSWAGEHNRAQHVDLSTLVTNFDNAVGGNTCSSVLPDHGWDAPVVENSTVDFRSLAGASAGFNIITSVDAYKGKLYLSVGQAPSATDPTFFIFDIAKLKTNQPALLGKFDIASNTTKGSYALAVADGATAGSIYAYTASEFVPSAGWGCTQTLGCSQLQIVTAGDPTKLSTTTTAFLKMPTVTGTGAQGAGASIFYKDGVVYLGLTKTATGPEFNTIDVHDPMHPVWLGGYSVGATVNSIIVSGNYAYLATNDTGREVIVLDVSNPNAPLLATSYDASSQYGYVLAKKGDTLYLGRQYQSGAPELMLLDASSSALIPNPPLQISDVGTTLDTFSISALVVRDYLTFFVGGNTSASDKGRLFIQKTSGAGAVTNWATPLPMGPANTQAQALDCEANDLFIGTNNLSTGDSYLSVVTSAP